MQRTVLLLLVVVAVVGVADEIADPDSGGPTSETHAWSVNEGVVLKAPQS